MKKGIIYLLLSVLILIGCCVPYLINSTGLANLSLYRDEAIDTGDYPCEFPIAFNSKLESVSLGGKSCIYYSYGEDVLPALAILGQTQTVADTPIPPSGEEMRGVWIPYLSLFGVDAKDIDTMVQKVKNVGLNTIFLHVRPFGDALYNSDYYPWSHLITGTQGQAPSDGFDPLAYAVEACHKNGIKLHAWINPLRIQSGGSTPSSLAGNNPAVLAMAEENNRRVIEYNGSLYYNPANEENIILIVNGVKEILTKYNVDGIHFDDYFYPSDGEDFNDYTEYAQYTAAGGTLSLDAWRRNNISSIIKRVYSAVKQTDSDALFGISPSGNIERCISYGADVALWCSQEGYVDYICPQIYWSQTNVDYPFEATAKRWRSLVTSQKVKLYIGLALYKAGSDSDNGTWQTADCNLADQVRLLRNQEIGATGFALYSYAYLDLPQTAAEMEKLSKVIKQ